MQKKNILYSAATFDLDKNLQMIQLQACLRNSYGLDFIDPLITKNVFGFWPPDQMTSSNGSIFSITGPLCGEFTVTGEFRLTDEFRSQRPVTRSFDVFFDPRLNKRLRKQPRHRWFEKTRAHYDVTVLLSPD